jgi:ERCC4-type nuclease
MASYRRVSMKKVVREIEAWRPRRYKRETEYRDKLHQKLEYAFREAPTKEYGHGRVRVDIAFERKIGIEIKKDLTTPTKLQRLKGQIQDMARTFKRSIVVVVGETHRDLMEDLLDTARKYKVTVIKK